MLEDRGYRIKEAPDGRAALDMLSRQDFNLVITDWMMPRMDGITLIRAIRARASNSYVYCIMLTASSDFDTLVSAMEAGVDDFLAKPLHAVELGARLRAAERVLALESGLALRNRRLAEANAQFESELRMARALQIDALPLPAQFDSLRFDGMLEASSYVGGDSYDFFTLGPGYVGFHLIDVSGHGVAAAMLAFNVQHQLLAASQQLAASMLAAGAGVEAAAIAVVSELNRRMLQMHEADHYLTMVYGIADLKTAAVALVQAGHPPPLLAKPGSDRFLPIGDGGLPVGILPEAEYEAHLVSLAPGARLVLYSDGVTECEDAGGQNFGIARLQALLAQQSGQPLAASRPALLAALHSWCEGDSFDDDVSFLVLEVPG